MAKLLILQDMLTLATKFYKDLFGFETSLDVSLGDNFWAEEEKVTLEENLMLQCPFSEEEIKEAVFGSYADGASGPDGFSFMYY